MAPSSFRAIFNTRQTRYVAKTDLLNSVIRDVLTVQGWLTLGAVGQTLLFLVLPTRYAVIPVSLFALRSVVSTIRQVYQPINDYNKDVAFGRVSAQPPNPSYDPDHPEDRPLFGPKPAREPLVVFHLGTRTNHPLGILAPGVKEIGIFFTDMVKELVDKADKYGCIGNSGWRAGERGNHNAGVVIFYFRNIEGLNAFAHDEVHRKGWDWYHKFVKDTGYKHVGIYHETFCVPAGEYETIYDNMPPTLLGNTNWPVINEKTGEKELIVPLVDGNTTLLRSQSNRMGRTIGGPKQMEGY